MALATLWALSVQKWSLYENGEKFWESGKKVREKWQPGENILCFVMAAQAALEIFRDFFKIRI